MQNHFWLDALGYAGSVLIVIAITMSSILRLRLINTAGAIAFVSYGLLIHAYPVAALNSVVVMVNIYYLTRMARTRRFFQLLNLKHESEYLRHFLGVYAPDIRKILPDFAYQPAADQLALFILHDCAPVGVFIGRQSASRLQVILDFAAPGYRDLKLGRFLFVEQADFFRERGIEEIVVTPRTRDFHAYLLKVGFQPAGHQQGALRIRFAA
jgi:hypothetical protein